MAGKFMRAIMLKQEIRKIYQQKRLQLPFEERQDMSVLMNYHFSKMSWPQLFYLLSYSPLTSKNEFEISGCEEMIRQKSPGVKVALPKTGTDLTHMRACLLTKNTLFVRNRFNILEPLDGEVVENILLDLAFVPLLAFDQRGYRVGYGKGFYDYFFAQCRADIIKVGFSFFEPVQEITDINEFDVPLNFCITPMRLYEF